MSAPCWPLDGRRETDLNSFLLYAGSAVLVGWGIAHIVPTRTVVRGFGDINRDSRLTITQTWVSEGLSLVFDGLLVFLVTATAGPAARASVVVCIVSAALMVVLAVWHLLTGSRTSIVPMKVCPAVLTVVAVLFLLGVLL